MDEIDVVTIANGTVYCSSGLSDVMGRRIVTMTMECLAVSRPKWWIDWAKFRTVYKNKVEFRFGTPGSGSATVGELRHGVRAR